MSTVTAVRHSSVTNWQKTANNEFRSEMQTFLEIQVWSKYWQQSLRQ